MAKFLENKNNIKKPAQKKKKKKQENPSTQERINQKSYGTTKPNVKVNTTRTANTVGNTNGKYQAGSTNNNTQQRYNNRPQGTVTRTRNTPATAGGSQYGRAGTNARRSASEGFQRDMQARQAESRQRNQKLKEDQERRRQESEARRNKAIASRNPRMQDTASSNNNTDIRQRMAASKQRREQAQADSERRRKESEERRNKVATSANPRMLDTARGTKIESENERAKRLEEARKQKNGDNSMASKSAQEVGNRIVKNLPKRAALTEGKIAASTGGAILDISDMLSGEGPGNGKSRDDLVSTAQQRKKQREGIAQTRNDIWAKRDEFEKKKNKLTQGAKGSEKAYYGAEESTQGMLSDFIASKATGGMWEVPLALRVYGESRGKAQQLGATETEDRLNAAKDALTEVVTEHIGGAFGMVGKLTGGSKLTTPFTKRLESSLAKRLEGKAGRGLATGALRWGSNVIGENVEEWIANPIENAGENLIYKNRIQKEREQETAAGLDNISRQIQETYMRDPQSRDAFVARLNSQSYRNELLEEYKGAGLTEKQANAVTDKMLEMMTAAATGDTKRMQEINEELNPILTGDIRNKIWDPEENRDSFFSTTLMTGVTSLPGTVTTSARGQAILESPHSQEKIMHALRKTIAFDKENAASAKAMLDDMEKGYKPAATQAYDIMQNEAKVLKESSDAQAASERTKEQRMKRENIMAPPAMWTEEGRNEIVGTKTAERFMDAMNDTLDYIDVFNRGRREGKIEENDASKICSAVAKFDVGTFTVQEAYDLAQGDKIDRHVFEQMTGVKLDQYNVYDKHGNLDVQATNIKMRDGLLALSADNYMKSARIEQENWNDEARGRAKETFKKGLGSEGTTSMHDALEAVDPRDQRTFMATAYAANKVYEDATFSNDEWNAVETKYKKMFPTVNLSSLKSVYEAGRRDKAEAETPYLNAIVDRDKAIGKIENGDAVGVVKGNFVNETPFNEETGEGRDLTASEQIVYEELAKNFNANITMVAPDDERLFTDKADKESRDTKINANVNIRTGDIFVSNAADAGVIVHEFTHLGAVLAPAQYMQMADYVIDKAYKYDSEGTKALFDKYKNKLYKGKNLSDAQIKEEVVADLVVDFINDETFVREIAQEEPSLARQIYNAICEMLRKLRNIISTGHIKDEAVRDAFLSEIDAYEQTRKMWLTMMHEASKYNAMIGMENLQNQIYEEGRQSISTTNDEFAIGEDITEEAAAAETQNARFSIVEDAETIKKLEADEHVTTYRGMVKIDGKYYSPMSSKVRNDDGKYELREGIVPGQWVKADITTDSKMFNSKGQFLLRKDNNKTIPAAYNPYMHSSTSMMNDQFETQYDRPNLVVIEGVVPKSELESGYRAEHDLDDGRHVVAKDATGKADWKPGPVERQIPKDRQRTVYLSNHFKMVREVPVEEVAQHIHDKLEGTGVPMTYNSVTPDLRKELLKLGTAMKQNKQDKYKVELDDEDLRLIEQNPNATRYSIADMPSIDELDMTNSTVEDENGDMVAEFQDNGSVRFSISSFEKSGRAIYQEYLNKQVKNGNLSRKEADDMLHELETVYGIAKEFADKTDENGDPVYAPFSAWSYADVVTDEKGKPVFSAIKKNSEYKMNIDFSTICKKRRTLDAVFREMINRGMFEKLDLNKDESAAMVVNINNLIRQHKFEAACALCFVEARRYRQQQTATTFRDMWNSIVESMYTGNNKAEYFNFGEDSTVEAVPNAIHTLDDSELDLTYVKKLANEKDDKGKLKQTAEAKAARLMLKDPSQRKLMRVGDMMASTGFENMQIKNPELMKVYNSKKGTGGAKSSFGDVQYLNEILKPRSFSRKSAYAVSGVRIQSFSDYVPRMVFDYVQVIADLAAKHLPAHGYTKEPLFVKQFGLTGAKINMSLVPDVAADSDIPGLDKDGNYIWNEEGTFPYDEAMAIQEAEGYKENCGTIAVGISDEHIMKMLADPTIQMVIPYHKSSLNPIVAAMTNVDRFENYEKFQTTKDENGNAVSKDFDWDNKLFRLSHDSKGKMLPKEQWGNVQDLVKEYADWCEQKNYTPKFEKFLYQRKDNKADGEILTDENGNKLINPGYYKLLEDFALLDNDGNFKPQGDVQMRFPTEDSAFGSMKGLIAQGLSEDTELEAKRSSEISGIVDEIEGMFDQGTLTEQSATSEKLAARMSISEDLDEPYMAAVNAGNMEEAQKYVEQAAKRAGYKTRAYHGTPSYGFTVFDSGFKNNGRAFGDGFYFTDIEEAAQPYARERKRYNRETQEMESMGQPGVYSVFLSPSDDALDFDYENYTYNGRKVGPTGKVAMMQMDIEAQPDKDVIVRNINDGSDIKSTVYVIKDAGRIKSADTVTYAEDGSVIPLSERFDPTNNDIRYSMSTEDADGNVLTTAQMEYFKNSQARDGNGRLVPVYHTTNRGGFTIFDPSYSNDRRSLFFASNFDVSQTYGDYGANHRVEFAEPEDIRNAEDFPFIYQDVIKKGYYEVYLNLENPLEVDAHGSNWNKIPYGDFKPNPTRDKALAKMESEAEFIVNNISMEWDDFDDDFHFGEYAGDFRTLRFEISGSRRNDVGGLESFSEIVEFKADEDKFEAHADEYSNPSEMMQMELYEHWESLGLSYEYWEEVMNYADDMDGSVDYSPLLSNQEKAPDYITADGYKMDYAEIFDELNEESDEEYSYSPYEGISTRTYKTRELAEIAETEGYDGVIIRNCRDIGGISSLKGGNPISDIFIAFSSNQVKDIRNENPTENPDIRFSITEDEGKSNKDYKHAMSDDYELLEAYEEMMLDEDLNASFADLSDGAYFSEYFGKMLEKYGKADKKARKTGKTVYVKYDNAADMLDAFYSALNEEVTMTYDDEILEEGRKTMAKSKRDFFSSVSQKWNERWISGGEVLDVDSVKTDVKNLVTGIMANSDTDKQYKIDLVKRTQIDMRNAYQFLKQGREDIASALLYHSALRMIQNVEFVRDDTDYQEYQGIRDYLRGEPIYMSEDYWQDEKFLEFRKAHYGTLKLRKGKTNVDTVYGQLADLFPGVFSEAERERLDFKDDKSGMLQHIGYVTELNLEPFMAAYSSEECADWAFEIADDLYEIMVNGSAVESIADEYKARNEKALEKERARTEKAVRTAKAYKEKYDAQAKAMKTRHAEAILRIRKARDEGIKAEKQKFKEYKEEQKENRLHSKYFDSIAATHKTLRERLLTNTKDKHIPEVYKAQLAELLASFDLQTVASKKVEARRGRPGKKTIKMSALRTTLKNMAAKSELFYLNDTITDIMDELLGIRQGDAYSRSIDGLTLDELNASELKKIDRMLKALLHEFNNYESVRVGTKRQQAADIGTAQIDSCLDHAGKFGEGRDYQNFLGALDNIIGLDEMTPAYMFRQIDPQSNGIGLMFKELRRSFGKYVRNQNQLNEWMEEIIGEYHNKGKLWNKYGAETLEDWRISTHAKEFQLTNGTVKMTPAQMMSIYCLSKRQQAYDHMTGAGIVVQPVSFQARVASDLKKKANYALPVILTDSDIKLITSQLTPDQIKVAEKLQELMATKMAEWGNEASMSVLGIRLFEDPDYFPIKSDKAALEKDFSAEQFMECIRNFGFTKAVQPGARNAIAIGDIFDVVAEHCNNMNLYNAYSESMSDFMKVYNYHALREDGSDYSVEQAIAHAYSKKATTFIGTFMKDLNGNVSKERTTGIEQMINDSLGKAKKASVFANGRVALQQPTALMRAFAVISPKYLKGVKAGNATMQEMFEHSPIALWKSWGYYDINMGKSIEDLMMNNGSWAEDKMSDIYGELDNRTWAIIWTMCKNEIEDKHKGVEKGSDEYWELVSERFDEVVDLTQVVDSPFHRSHAMRSKSTLVKMATAFMAEPTLTFNMMRDGLRRAKEEYRLGNKKSAAKIVGRTATVFVLSAWATAAAAAIWDAVRGKSAGDDDDEQGFFDMWYTNMIENLKDNLNLLNNIYWVKDLVSLFQGWDQRNLGLQGWKHLSDAFRQMKGEKVYSKLTWYENALAGIGYLSGIPFKTMMTDGKAVFKMFGLTTPKLLQDQLDRLDSIGSSTKDMNRGKSSDSGVTSEKASKDEKGSSAGSAHLWTYDNAPFHVEDGSLADNFLNHFGINLTSAELAAIERSEEEKEIDAKIQDIQSKTEGLSQEEKNQKIYSMVTRYMKDHQDGKPMADYIAAGDYWSIGDIGNMYIRAGGDGEYFKEKVFRASKSAMKKTISADNNESQKAAQARIKDYLLTNGMTEQELSDIAYKSYTRKDLQVAFRINDEDAIITELRALMEAGMTREDIYKAYDNRNRVDLVKYKDAGGKYADRLKSTGTYNWPCNGTITSHYGHRHSPGNGVGSTNHQGLDIGASMGAPVTASDGGTVVMAKWYSGYGKTVQIQHDDGTITQYSHLSWWEPKVGDVVAQGQEIGKVGSTGNSTGPHLHFGVMKDGHYVDPEDYLNRKS